MIIVIVIIGISALVLVHELGHFWAAKYFQIQVEEFGFGFPPRLFGKKIGETCYSFNWLPFGGFVKLSGEFEKQGERSFMNQKIWKRAVVLAAGVVMNFLFGWLLLSLIFFIGSPVQILINQVLPESPAAAAGILAGDRIVGFASTQEFINFIQNNDGQEITINLLRQQEETIQTLSLKIIPQKTIGVGLREIGFPAQPLLASIGNGLLTSLALVGSVFIALGSIFSTPENFVGPVGIFNIALETGKLGFIYVFQLLALISLNLAVLNLLPIPALDGGRLLFLIIEKIKGSPIASQKEIFWHSAGFLLLVFLIILITAVDIIRFF